MEYRNLYIYEYISHHFMRKILMLKGKIRLEDDIEQLYEKKITKFGTGAKIDAPKEFIGKKTYVLIRK